MINALHGVIGSKAIVATITVSATSLSFADTTEGTNSAQQSFNVSGSGLTGDIVVTPPTGAKISLTSGSGYSSSSINLTPSGGTVSSTPIYVVFSPVVATTYSANITCTATGATTKNVAISGQGTSTLLVNLTASYSLDGNANKNVGSNNGTATNVTYGTGAISGQCGVFNGTSKISIPDSSDFTLGSNNFAYAIRIKRALTATREIFTGQSNTVGTTFSVSFWLEFNTSNQLVFIGTNGTSGSPISINTGFTISDTNWHNIIVQRVGNNIEIYVDASLVNATTPFASGDIINNSSYDWGIGNAGALSILQFTGSIQDEHLWKNKVLTSTEITTAQNLRYPFTV